MGLHVVTWAGVASVRVDLISHRHGNCENFSTGRWDSRSKHVFAFLRSFKETNNFLHSPSFYLFLICFSGCGFVGRNLVAFLVQNNLASHVRVVDKVPPQVAWLNSVHRDVFADSIVEFKSANLISSGKNSHWKKYSTTRHKFVVTLRKLYFFCGFSRNFYHSPHVTTRKLLSFHEMCVVSRLLQKRICHGGGRVGLRHQLRGRNEVGPNRPRLQGRDTEIELKLCERGGGAQSQTLRRAVQRSDVFLRQDAAQRGRTLGSVDVRV